MYVKIKLSGHVHNHPERKIQAYVSAPNELSADQTIEYIVGFAKAFQLTDCEAT
jgi:hypothetical protein